MNRHIEWMIILGTLSPQNSAGEGSQKANGDSLILNFRKNVKVIIMPSVMVYFWSIKRFVPEVWVCDLKCSYVMQYYECFMILMIHWKKPAQIKLNISIGNLQICADTKQFESYLTQTIFLVLLSGFLGPTQQLLRTHRHTHTHTAKLGLPDSQGTDASLNIKGTS